MIALEIHICDQRRSYLARFSTEAQAVAFVSARFSTHTRDSDCSREPSRRPQSKEW